MRTDDFDYDLPAELIAQQPADRRDEARLLVLDRRRQSIAHHVFRDLPALLAAGDLLVLNDTRVLPARVVGRRERTGGRWEGLFLRELPDGSWEMLARTRGRPEPGEAIVLQSGLRLLVMGPSSHGQWLLRPKGESAAAVEVLARHGQVPLPPYIRKGRETAGDRERYQTVYARRPGAVAAPTAGLHFTPELLDALDQHGIGHAFVTLHVGAGTFRPIQSDQVEAHEMHQEWGELSVATAEAIAACRAGQHRIVAVGTTSVRVLETAAGQGQSAWSGPTGLYIYPPYQFRMVDALITNFHLPRTSLLVLVSAFAGVDFIRQAYAAAIRERYRFYSYGDAMLIV